MEFGGGGIGSLFVNWKSESGEYGAEHFEFATLSLSSSVAMHTGGLSCGLHLWI